MGEAKRRKLAQAAGRMIYHHTSTLRTNLIWMSGQIELEGRGLPAFHPIIGTISTNALLRRPMRDFPALAWFTTQIAVPQCLQINTIFLTKRETGERIEIDASASMANIIALNRLALGFPSSSIPAIQWRLHSGYDTPEGRELNETARDVGDDPDDWWVSESPVDVLQATEVWGSRSKLKPKLERFDWYLKDVHNMVRMCRERKDVYIPPAWLSEQQARKLATTVGLPITTGGALP